jgi:hypothetical protein
MGLQVVNLEMGEGLQGSGDKTLLMNARPLGGMEQKGCWDFKINSAQELTALPCPRVESSLASFPKAIFT